MSLLLSGPQWFHGIYGWMENGQRSAKGGPIYCMVWNRVHLPVCRGSGGLSALLEENCEDSSSQAESWAAKLVLCLSVSPALSSDFH